MELKAEDKDETELKTEDNRIGPNETINWNQAVTRPHTNLGLSSTARI